MTTDKTNNMTSLKYIGALVVVLAFIAGFRTYP
jgi:hypothetical protein